VRHVRYLIENKKGNGFIITSRPMEKVALDLADVRQEGQYIIIVIDCFTRDISTTVLKNKSADGIVKVVES
jgi:hypothetical protein